MTLPIESFSDEFDPSFKVFHELMAKKVRDILLVSTPYDAWIMEEDCRLSERIIHEYRGLNLSHPPRLHLGDSQWFFRPSNIVKLFLPLRRLEKA